MKENPTFMVFVRVSTMQQAVKDPFLSNTSFPFGSLV
jgi:hypothetical protein